MALNKYDMGSCCVAKVIDNWLGKEEDHGNMFCQDGSRITVNDYQSYKEFATRELKSFCGVINQHEAGGRAGGGGPNEFRDLRNLAVFTATLRGDQVWALQFAKEVGFTRTRPLIKGRYNRDTEMRLLWISSFDLFDWFEKNNNA